MSDNACKSSMKAFATLTTLAALSCLLLTPASCDVLDGPAPASHRRNLRRDSTGKGRAKNDKSDVLDDELDVPAAIAAVDEAADRGEGVDRAAALLGVAA